MRQHLKPSNPCTLLHRAMLKYGADQMTVESFEVSDCDLNYHEAETIMKYATLAPNGYNLKTGGDVGFRLSEETKLRMRKSQLGVMHTAATKDKIRKALTGRKYSQERKDNMRSGRYGRRLTESEIIRTIESHTNGAEAARALGISRQTVHRFIKLGKASNENHTTRRGYASKGQDVADDMAARRMSHPDIQPSTPLPLPEAANSACHSPVMSQKAFATSVI